MSYAQQTDLLQRLTNAQLVQLTDDAVPPATINVTIVQGELDEATAMIDSYTRDRYQTPLQASNTVVTLCRDIAVYGLYSRRPQTPMPLTVRTRYEDAVRLLKDVSTNKASLDQPSGATPQQPTATAQRPTHARQVFGERNLEGFI